jgi:hypothetical protein
MKRHTFFTVVSAAVLLSGCFWGRTFDLTWSEEVKLQDGRLLIVELKHTYERLHQGITPYGGTILTRDTTLAFDAGPGVGTVTQLFKGFQPIFLDQHAGVWYAVLSGSPYYGSQNLPGQNWGTLEGPYGQWAVRLDAGKWVPISMSRLPDSFQTPNMLIKKGWARDHVQFDGKRVTLTDKAEWLSEHPWDYAEIRLTRPTTASPCRPDSANPCKPPPQ